MDRRPLALSDLPFDRAVRRYKANLPAPYGPVPLADLRRFIHAPCGARSLFGHSTLSAVTVKTAVLPVTLLSEGSEVRSITLPVTCTSRSRVSPAEPVGPS